MLYWQERGIIRLPSPLPERALEELNSIYPGMTRAELEVYLRPEGGIHTRGGRAYVTRACRYVHITLTFTLCTPQEPGSADREQWAGDTIHTISEPYLANFFNG